MNKAENTFMKLGESSLRKKIMYHIFFCLP